MTDSIFLKDSKEQICVDVVSEDKQQRLCVVSAGEEPSVVLMEGAARLREWPLHTVRLLPYPQGCGVTLEADGEVLSWSCGEEATRWLVSLVGSAGGTGRGGGEVALGALLELEGGAEDEDAEAWVRVLGERVARLDADNVAGMLAAATQRDGALLAARLEAAGESAAAHGARHARSRTALRPPGAPDAPHARPPAPDHNARVLLHELEQIFCWLDAPPLRDLDSLSEVSLASVEGRSRALEAGLALCAALRAERSAGAAAWRRLRGVRDRLRRVARARDGLCAAAARHLNNLLIHLGNEAAAAPTPPSDHHRQLLPYAPFMRFLKENDQRAYDALLKVYVSTWSRVYERAVRTGAGVAAGGDTPSATDLDLDEQFDAVLTLAEAVCNAEQDFCTQFFHLDVDVKSDSSDGEKSEKSDKSDPGECGAGGARGRGGGGGGGLESRRVLAELFPALEQELVALVQRLDAQRPYGAMRALACAGRRALGEGGGEGRWSRAVVASAAVCAKRAADRSLADTVAALPDHVKQASRRAKCGVLGFVRELEAWGGACEAAFAGGRRADLDRWYLTLVSAMMQTIQAAEHPRTPRSVLHMENYHALGGAVAALRVPALEGVRRECRTREHDAQRAYVTRYFGRPLDKINLFFDGVSEAVAGGAREEEVCYRAAFSKHELRRLLQLYPANEVRKSLHRLYRTVEKHLSEEGGLLQVVWRAMQEEFLAQHHHLQARIAACYPGAGLALPLSTQDILDAFSDIAREH